MYFELRRGGRGEIRTLDDVAAIPVFETSALDQLCDPSITPVEQGYYTSPTVNRTGRLREGSTTLEKSFTRHPCSGDVFSAIITLLQSMYL